MTVMWEAKAAPARGDELLAWVLAQLPGGPVYRNGERVVALLDEPGTLPEPPSELLARPVHTWRFSRVR